MAAYDDGVRLFTVGEGSSPVPVPEMRYATGGGWSTPSKTGGGFSATCWYPVFFWSKYGSKWSLFGRLDPSGDRGGDDRPQQSPGWAAGAGLPSSSASSVWTDSDEI